VLAKTALVRAPALLLGLALALQPAAETRPDAGSGELSPAARKVVDYLLADWQKQFRSTSIDKAMTALGMAADDDLRLAIGEHFRAHPELSRNLRYWGANNYLLSNDEKRIAKVLINAFRDEERLPDAAEIARVVELPQQEVAARLAYLARAGLLERRGETYAPADGWQTWGGPLRYNFHTVTVEGQAPFDVW